MDWSEILSESEAAFMRRVSDELRKVPWAVPLVHEIENRGGITYENKPLLFEARIAYELHRQGATGVKYEFEAGVGNSTVDFRLGPEPDYLIEIVSVGRSDAKKRAAFHNEQFYGTVLSSPHEAQSAAERQQSEEGESLLVVQKIGEKVYDRKSRTPIKFPPSKLGSYHVVAVDMRGHLGGGDGYDWQQIAFGADTVPPEWRKYWLDQDDQLIPFRGVWDPKNPMGFASTARERLHAIMFVAEKRYDDGAVCEGAWIAGNPHLFGNKDEFRRAFKRFPLQPFPRPAARPGEHEHDS
jgi:hypothetical protein